MNHLDQKVRYCPDVCESNRVCLNTGFYAASFHCSSVLQPDPETHLGTALRDRRELPKKLGKARNTGVFLLDETPNARIDSSPPSSHIHTSCLNIKEKKSFFFKCITEQISELMFLVKGLIRELL